MAPPLVFTFQPMGYTAACFAICSISVNGSGGVTITKPNLSDPNIKLEPGSICNEEYARGNMQVVYQVLFESSSFEFC